MTLLKTRYTEEIFKKRNLRRVNLLFKLIIKEII
nr:MAG TPA: hypothetical protein [Caudoviricetes sp.]